jgi:hypothetical protein
MREIPQIDQVAFADLAEMCFDAAFDADYPDNGMFIRQTRRGHDYWYFQGYGRVPEGESRRQSLKYVGPAHDPELTKRVEAFARNKVGWRVRKGLASRLRAAGLPSPTRIEGDVLDALARAGIFRLRAVLVGSLAFQAYSGVLSVRLPSPIIAPTDADFALFFGIAQQIDDVADDLEAALKGVDATFAPLVHADAANLVRGFQSASGYRVEFLTPNRGDRDYAVAPAPMPALGQVICFLDFLIRKPVRSLILHGSGVSVVVPAPERFAIHKLIASTLRAESSSAKIGNDMDQSRALIEAFGFLRREAELGLAWIEAFECGPSWRRRLLMSAQRLDDEALSVLSRGVESAALLDGLDPSAFGVVGGRDAVLARLASFSARR